MTDCPKCGGTGGSPGAEFGDHGWHPCYFCGETGKVSEDARAAWIGGMMAHEDFVNPDRVWVGGDYDDEGFPVRSDDLGWSF